MKICNFESVAFCENQIYLFIYFAKGVDSFFQTTYSQLFQSFLK